MISNHPDVKKSADSEVNRTTRTTAMDPPSQAIQITGGHGTGDTEDSGCAPCEVIPCSGHIPALKPPARTSGQMMKTILYYF